jgi:hypothetical protein
MSWHHLKVQQQQQKQQQKQQQQQQHQQEFVQRQSCLLSGVCKQIPFFFFKKLQFCNQNCLRKIAVAWLAHKIGASRHTYLYFFIVGATELLDISSDISSCRLSGKRRAPISLPCISVCAIMSSSYHMAMSLFQPLPTAAQLESDRHHI